MDKIPFDNTRKVKEESDTNGRKINFISNRVAPIAAFKTPACKVGKRVYHVGGKIPGKVESMEGDWLVIREQWQKAEEWKPTPWTDEEKKEYFSHRKSESERMDAETSHASRLFDAREKLRKEFC